MKKTKQISFFSLYKSFRENLITHPMVSLGNLFELPVLLKKMGWRLTAASFPKIVKFNGRLRQLSNFGRHIIRMRKHHGDVFVVKYLKASQLAISKAIAGNPFKTLRELEPDLPLPRLSSSGLPSVIPLGDRRAILSGSASVIRWWQTLFGLYRIIQIPGKTKLDTITAPFSGDEAFLNEASLDLEILFSKFMKVHSWKTRSGNRGLLFLETSSPNYVVSWLGIVQDAILLDASGFSESLLHIIRGTRGIGSRLEKMYLNCVRLGKLRGYITQNYSGSPLKDNTKSVVLPVRGVSGTSLSSVEGSLGQLALKEEAAGKVRVFAMVDVWTQSVLKPVHDSISLILKSLPNDGTFDQDGAVKRCFIKAKSAGLSYGYDLSAATDRLPVLIQARLLSAFYGDCKFGLDWKNLLVGREYWLDDMELKYSVGQPMGALSSFNMLALTHHLIVQYCAAKAHVAKYGIWWDGYELLGDDIVIFDTAVSDEYLSFMAKIGMEINVKKSVIARNETFEFAKVTGHKGHNVSAVSWKMFISQNSFIGRANIGFSLLRKRIGTPGFWLKNVLRHRRYTQGDFKLSLVAVWSMFAGSRFLELEQFLPSLISKTRGWAKPYLQVEVDLRKDHILNLMGQCLEGRELSVDKTQQLANIWRQIWPYLKGHKLEAIRRYWEKYFDDNNCTQVHLCNIADNICSMIACGFTGSPVGAPKELCPVHECFDQLWWDIHDHLEDDFMRVRRKLDKVGLTPIDLISMEELETASSDMKLLDSLVGLPSRALDKIAKGGAPEPKFSSAVDVLTWISNARRLRLRRVPMDWFSSSWDVWYH